MNTTSAHQEVFERERPRLYALARRITRSNAEAEDVVQDAAFRWQAVAPDSIRIPAAFLTRMVTRLALNVRSAARSRDTNFGDESYPQIGVRENHRFSARDPQELAELSDEMRRAFTATLYALNPVERAVLILHDVIGFTYAEVGEMLGKSGENCRQIEHRARNRLTRCKRRDTQAAPAAADAMVRSFLGATQGAETRKFEELLVTAARAYSLDKSVTRHTVS